MAGGGDLVYSSKMQRVGRRTHRFGLVQGLVVNLPHRLNEAVERLTAFGFGWLDH